MKEGANKIISLFQWAHRIKTIDRHKRQETKIQSSKQELEERLGLIGAGGRNRTDTPFGNQILSLARLPVPPHPHR